MKITIEKDDEKITLGISEKRISERGASYDVGDMLQNMFNLIDDAPITVTVEDGGCIYVAHNLDEIEKISTKIDRFDLERRWV